jgi:hypothetical protein
MALMLLTGGLARFDECRSATILTNSHDVILQLTDPVAPGEPPRVYRVKAEVDQHGSPKGYSLQFTTHVCIDDQCRAVTIIMRWDALGRYQSLETPEHLPLTRKKHTPFTPEDYQHLDRILKDSQSVLKNYSLESLAASTQVADEAGLDGVSGATPLSVKNAVVPDAAYTTWTMWHWANGEIVEKLKTATTQRATIDFLKQLLDSEVPTDMEFALRTLIEGDADRGAVEQSLVDSVWKALHRSDRELASLALNFLSRNEPDIAGFHESLIESIFLMRKNYSAVILEYFAEQTNLPIETMEKLVLAVDRMPYFQLHTTLNLLEQNAFWSPLVESQLTMLLDHDNFFIARRCFEALSARSHLNETTHERMASFRHKHQDRLR